MNPLPIPVFDYMPSPAQLGMTYSDTQFAYGILGMLCAYAIFDQIFSKR